MAPMTCYSMSLIGVDMKKTVLSALILIALTGTGAAMVSKSSPAATNPTVHLTREQMAHLLNVPNTPEGHHELAKYFRQEAQHSRDKEQQYRGMAETYRLHPPRVDAYRNESIEAHYERLAAEARNAAVACEQQASFQDKLAKSLAAAK